VLVDGAADFTRGDGPYAGHAIGLASGLPALARSGPSRGFPCQIRRGPGAFRLTAARMVFVVAPADRRWARRSGSFGGSGGVGRRVGGASGPAGRLEDVQKVLTDGCRHGSRHAVGHAVGPHKTHESHVKVRPGIEAPRHLCNLSARHLSGLCLASRGGPGDNRYHRR
jgi:hypothetical protein